ncbi:tetratricopeptide repeat protein [Taibaiella lutea]|uniref:tetratricopeptide repeat protein n=1 Tax=Taibaiella lutea TaxID=2608001 RepID=UPI00167FE0C7|nr:tetratricopeptide repeat protein [Taibaiella lutea]
MSAQTAPAPKPQNVNPELRKGNELYKDKKYKDAQRVYTTALQKNPLSRTGMFNLGDALYKSKDYENSRKVLEASIKNTKDKKEQARAYHNIGNTYLEEKKWEDAINAYKESLRRDPTDADTKYNLAYANAMLKKDGGGGKNNKDKKDNKDNKDKQNQDKKEQDKKDQDKKDGDKKDQQDKKDENKQEQKPQGQPSKLTKEQADNLLNALQQEEKKLQDKKEKGKAVPVKMEKDW